ncbi:hypothetical protein, partial [Hyphococcus sp.]|uniref:hypothetical protein n=1 Tax=Hyphococcus sp. TaxID=2038636 RepID=UPI0037519B68
DLATYLATLSYRVEAWNVGVQLPGGRLAVVKADTVAIGRLRSWSVEIGGEIVDATHSLDEWRRFTPSEVASWSATLVMTLDDSDAGQALLAAQSVHEFEIYPRGEAGGAWVGGAIVASIDEGVTDGGDVVRTVTISGNAGLIR